MSAGSYESNQFSLWLFFKDEQPVWFYMTT